MHQQTHDRGRQELRVIIAGIFDHVLRKEKENATLSAGRVEVKMDDNDLTGRCGAFGPGPMKKKYSPALMTAVVALLIICTFVYASKEDRGFESTANQPYAFKTHLTSEASKIRSVNGVGTLTGRVSEESHKPLVQETVEGLPNVKRVDNRLEAKGERRDEKPAAVHTAKVKTTLLLLMCMSSR